MANCECHVPDDIIFNNIIPKLPAKSVIRFKSVCKSWLHNTGTSNFIQLHLRQSLLDDSHPSILLSKYSPICLGNTIHELETSRVRPIKLPSLPSDVFIILGFCNGLVLVRGKTWHNRCFVWNPSNPNVFRRLNFDHINYRGKKSSWHPLILAYDETSDEYKMILNNDDRTEFLVYRLKGGSWKSLAIPPGRDKIVIKASGARLNNCLNFLRTDNICRFDLGGEIWDDEPDIFPNLPNDNCELRHFAKQLDVYKGMLSMVVLVKKNEHRNHGHRWKWDDTWFRYEFWVMKEYGVKKSWTRLFRLQPSDSISRVFYSRERDRPLLVDYEYHNLAWYNSSEDDVEEINIQEKLRFQEVQSFVPTLVPVDSISRHGITIKI